MYIKGKINTMKKLVKLIEMPLFLDIFSGSFSAKKINVTRKTNDKRIKYGIYAVVNSLASSLLVCKTSKIISKWISI